MDVSLFSKLTSIGGTATGTRTPVFAVRGRRLNRLTMAAYLAAEPGFEPGLNESESFVLPLHNSAMSSEHDVPDRQEILYFLTGEKSSRFCNFICFLRSKWAQGIKCSLRLDLCLKVLYSGAILKLLRVFDPENSK